MINKLPIQTIDDLKTYLRTLSNPPADYKIAVGSLIFTPDDAVILLERGNEAKDAIGKLEGVGGALNSDETDLIEALRREIREEIDVEVEVDEMLTVKIMTGTTYPYWVVVDYLCRLKHGQPTVKEPQKIKQIHYVRLTEIDDEKLSEYQKVAMNIYREKYGSKPFYKN